MRPTPSPDGGDDSVALPRTQGPAALRIRTLGTPDVRAADGTSLGSLLAQPKRAAILFYLACSPRGTHVSRDHLLSVFWPDFDDERARNSLRTALHYVRRSVGPAVVVSRPDGSLGVDPARVEVDVWAFEDAVEGQDWPEALALYGGDFLDGFFVAGCAELEQWTESRRSRLRRRAADALWHQSLEDEARGDLASATVRMRRSLDLFPANESVVRRLLSLLARMGDRGTAAEVFDDFARRLEVEYQLQVAPETRALAEEIAAGGLRPGRSQEEEPLPPTPGEDAGAATAAGGNGPEPAAGTVTDVADPTPRSRIRRAFRRPAGIVLLTVLAVLAWRFLPPGTKSLQGADRCRVVVLPFTQSGFGVDPGLASGFAQALSAQLDRTPGLRALPTPGAERPARGSSDGVDPTAARRTARAAGAGAVILGSILAVDDRVRVTASLLDVTDPSADPRWASAEGPARSLLALVDSTAGALAEAAAARPAGTCAAG